MPFVKASADSSHLELIKQGKVRTLSAFVPDDDGTAILVVFMNPTRMAQQVRVVFQRRHDDRRVLAPEEVRQAVRELG